MVASYSPSESAREISFRFAMQCAKCQGPPPNAKRKGPPSGEVSLDFPIWGLAKSQVGIGGSIYSIAWKCPERSPMGPLGALSIRPREFLPVLMLSFFLTIFSSARLDTILPIFDGLTRRLPSICGRLPAA